HVDRPIRANHDPARSVKARFRAFPLGDESPVGSQLLHTVIAGVCHIDVARHVNGDPIRLAELSVTGSFRSYSAEESASGGILLDTSVTSVGDQNIATGIYGNPSRRIELSLSGALAAFEHVSHTFR